MHNRKFVRCGNSGHFLLLCILLNPAKTIASYEDVLRGLSRVPALQSGEDCVMSQKNVYIGGSWSRQLRARLSTLPDNPGDSRF